MRNSKGKSVFLQELLYKLLKKSLAKNFLADFFFQFFGRFSEGEAGKDSEDTPCRFFTGIHDGTSENIHEKCVKWVLRYASGAISQ